MTTLRGYKNLACQIPDILRCQVRRKVFCVGRNKTGTTSLAKALEELGLVVAPQPPFEKLIADWKRRDFRKLIRYCRLYQAFQDIPFSWPFTFQMVDRAFPGSKFILTERDSPEQWYDSITKFHGKRWSSTPGPPSAEELKQAEYRHTGWAWEANRATFDSPDDDPYRREDLIAMYELHNRIVKEYFRHRPGDLLVLNVAQKGSMKSLCDFLELPYTGQEFPWENKTAETRPGGA